MKEITRGEREMFRENRIWEVVKERWRLTLGWHKSQRYI
jgi:hypothetical protein